LSSLPASTRNARRPRVVLYNPRATFYTMPLALIAVGSHLDRQRFDVVVVDARVEPDPPGALERALDGALCLGVTVLTGSPIRDAVQASRLARRIRPGLPVIWGGWHPSMFGRECLAEPAVDATVQGQGEATFAEVVERLARGDRLEGCAGTTVRAADGSVVVNPPRALAPLAAFAPHDYSLVDAPRYFALKGKRQLDYITSQGCHFRCAFCADPFVYERQWVGLPPGRVVAEIAELHARHGFADVNFQDETFFTGRGRVEAIAEGLLAAGLGVSWAATMRADQGVRLPEDSLALCRRSGLRRVLMGVESGSPETLKRIRKDTTLEQVFESAERLARHGIAGHFPFIVGFPGEDEASIQASLDVAKRLRAISPDFQTPFFYFKPYPGTPLTDEAVALGFRLPSSLDEWADFDFGDGEAGPWVSARSFEQVERFKR
jgi:anaerobic magnesium-protoporphyrin IX monomethyl ester cyclase